MKKLLLLCLLGYLCVPTSTSTAQVAESPPGTDLVYQPGFPGQEGESPSARLGALIYGELINPDSLGPLTLTFTSNYLSRSSTYSQVTRVPEIKEGTFFDGVLDPRVRRFLAYVPDFDRPQYMTLKIGEHTVLDKYLLFPSDSIKLEVNLLEQQLNFAGPASDGFELQYQVKRLRAQEQFDRSRKIVLADPIALLDQEDYREQWEAQKSIFGARLEFEQFDQEGLISLLEQIENADQELSGYDFLLAQNENILSTEKIELYKLEVLGQYYQPLLSRLYRFYFPELHRIYVGEELHDAHQKIKSLLESIPVNDFSQLSRLVASSWLDMELDRITLLALIENQSFFEVMNEHHAGELADRLSAGFLTQNLSSYPEPGSMLNQYLAQMEAGPWKDKVWAMKVAVVPGDPILDLDLESLQNDTLSISELTGKPSLIYFYFSTCPHSAHYFKDMLYPLYQKKAKSMGVDLIAISVDRDPDLWHNQLSEYSDPSIPNYRMLKDSKEVFKDYYEVSGYPRTFLIDGDGVILSFGLSRNNYAAFESDFLKEVRRINSNSSLSTAKLKKTP
ncbi:TlpA disulfide reductase family protein [Algoriphagus sp. C2-6-M1]|uniref:TlpA family protein disulfide reductase n=1 Tax=Algoriphagus persicinus TaxID=3108754 RepID=UPI002B3B3D68|nr:TlpA disulfide reductase family protein [Algoriphagus sp. C2-6-M1]MEB2782678.1 TlpA disulfide reductase family protein [Algoriphagus sp. C2-6-M1]